MTAVLTDHTMAKRNDVTVKLDANIVRDAKLVAVYRDISIAELLSGILGPIVARMLEEEQAKHAKASRAAKGKGGEK